MTLGSDTVRRAKRSHYVPGMHESVHSLRVPYHDHEELHVADFFSGLGYLLAYQGSQMRSLSELLQLLSIYSQFCRNAARFMYLNPPTVVQLLWETQSRNSAHAINLVSRRFSLASSVIPGKGGGREDVREQRVQALQQVWSPVLRNPTPVQKAHAEAGISYAYPTEELFGTPWGHCSESVTFASMHKTMQSRVPLGTLALSVKSMTSPMPGVSTTPVEAIFQLQRLQDMVEVLLASGALRPMCLNCQHLSDSVSARIEDFACLFASRRLATIC
ncbi:hypothetical protein HDZ31DRAFT_78452 [Schizophyllum fasciatum]